MLTTLAVAAACSGPEEVATSDQTAATETVYVNGLIYTQDRDLPWAESLVTKGDRIVFVGSDEDALQYAGGDSKRVDLQGQFVMPGIIDAHTHPGLISTGADLSVQCGVGRFAASVAVSEGGCSPLSVCRQNAPAGDLPRSLNLSLR